MKKISLFLLFILLSQVKPCSNPQAAESIELLPALSPVPLSMRSPAWDRAAQRDIVATVLIRHNPATQQKRNDPVNLVNGTRRILQAQ